MGTGSFLLAVGVWGILVLCAISNGIFRQSALVPRMGEKAAHIVSTLSLSAIILAVSYLFLLFTDTGYSEADLWLIGFTWAGLTVVFEFGFGHYVVRKPWSVLLEDYNILKGRIWVIVLVVTLTAPNLAGAMT